MAPCECSHAALIWHHAVPDFDTDTFINLAKDGCDPHWIRRGMGDTAHPLGNALIRKSDCLFHGPGFLTPAQFWYLALTVAVVVIIGLLWAAARAVGAGDTRVALSVAYLGMSPAMRTMSTRADEKWIGLAASVAASVLPQVIGAIRRRKDFAPASSLEAGYGDTADVEQKWVAALARAVVPAAISAAPGLISAVRGKDFAPYPASVLTDQQRSVEGFTTEDEKVLRAMAPVVAATLPAVAQAMRGGTDRRYRAAI